MKMLDSEGVPWCRGSGMWDYLRVDEVERGSTNV